MNTQPVYGLKQLLTHVIGDMAKALAERHGETTADKIARTNAAVHMIVGFLPRDVIETMLAGHCVMFHELIVDSVRHMFLGEPAADRRSSRGGIVAMDKCFANNLERLKQLQSRPARSNPEAAEATAAVSADQPIEAMVAAATKETAARKAAPTGRAPLEAAAPAPDTRTPGAQTPGDQTPGNPVAPAAHGASLADPTISFTPSKATIAACEANPAAMAALEAGDPEAFARAMGVASPSEEYLAAANAPGSPFDRSAARGGAAAAQSPAPRHDPATVVPPSAAR